MPTALRLGDRWAGMWKERVVPQFKVQDAAAEYEECQKAVLTFILKHQNAHNNITHEYRVYVDVTILLKTTRIITPLILTHLIGNILYICIL